MQPLIQILQLANDRYAVQVAHCPPGGSYDDWSDWVTKAEFASEREAELHARDLADSYPRTRFSRSSSFSSGSLLRPHSKFRLNQGHGIRIPID